jgi:hypothetical protein
MGINTSISATPYRRFVAEHPDQTSYFQPVLDLLDYRPSELELVPHVVFVEGKTDFYLLRYAHELLGFGSEIHLVPGTGASSLGPLIQLYVGWGKNFIVLLDGDAEGKRQKERYESDFGPVVAGRCTLLPEVCADQSAKRAEELLEDEDRQTVIAAVFGSEATTPTSKKAFSQAILELYARRQAVGLSSSATERLTGLLNRLCEMLNAQDSTHTK